MCKRGGGGPQWYYSSDYDFYGESGDSTQYHAIPWKYHTTTSTTTVQHLTFILHIWCYYALSNTMHYYEASPAIFLNIKNQVKLACCPVLLAPSIEDPGVAVNETPSSWISLSVPAPSVMKWRASFSIDHGWYLRCALTEDRLLHLNPVLGHTTPIWKPERPPWASIEKITFVFWLKHSVQDKSKDI